MGYAVGNSWYPGETSYESDIKAMEESFADAFKAGAQWRINSVWHDNSLHPTEDCDVLVETIRRIELDRYDVDYNELDSGADWETEVIRWAYIEDLLPERKEESI